MRGLVEDEMPNVSRSMDSAIADSSVSGSEAALHRIDDNIAELNVFLPEQQAAALEAAAESCGLSVAQLVRKVLRNFVEEDATRFAKPAHHVAPQNSAASLGQIHSDFSSL